MRTAGKSILYLLVGSLATLLGIIGIFLPGLPTVPFILVALWAFSRSSTRLHSWLQNIPILASTHAEIEQFQASGTVSRQTKLIAQVAAWGSAVLVLLFTHNFVLFVVLAAAALSCSVFMLSMPARRALDQED